MKSVFRFNKGDKVKEVYLNGLKQLENDDYVIRNNNIKFTKPVGGENNDIVTLELEKNYKVRK